MAIYIDSDFDKLTPNDSAVAQIVAVRTDSKGKIYGQGATASEKIIGKTMHKVIMIVME